MYQVNCLRGLPTWAQSRNSPFNPTPLNNLLQKASRDVGYPGMHVRSGPYHASSGKQLNTTRGGIGIHLPQGNYNSTHVYGGNLETWKFSDFRVDNSEKKNYPKRAINRCSCFVEDSTKKQWLLARSFRKNSALGWQSKKKCKFPDFQIFVKITLPRNDPWKKAKKSKKNASCYLYSLPNNSHQLGNREKQRCCHEREDKTATAVRDQTNSPGQSGK